MNMENDNSTAAQFGAIFIGLVCAGLSWTLLMPLMSSIALIILSTFIFLVTYWGIYEAFTMGDGSSKEPQTFGENAVNPSVSKMGLTDRDAWTDTGSAKSGSSTASLISGGMTKTSGTKVKTAPKNTAAKTTTAKPAAKKAATKTAKAPANKASTPKSAPKKTSAPKAAAKKAPVKKATAPKKAGPVRLKKAKGKADDLKMISGVGPKLEKTLNGLGFWHFHQIADWKRADVAIVDDELSFKGRIDRDEWIKQAKKLAKQKA